MPDLAVHLLSTYIVNKKLKFNVFLVLLGAMFPDILGRTLLILLPRNYLVSWISTLMHSPFFVISFVYVVSLLFEESKRREYFLALMSGSLGHLAADALQTHFRPSYYWFFPVSFKTYEIPLLWSDQFVLLILPLAAIAVIIKIRKSGLNLLHKG